MSKLARKFRRRQELNPLWHSRRRTSLAFLESCHLTSNATTWPSLHRNLLPKRRISMRRSSPRSNPFSLDEAGHRAIVLAENMDLRQNPDLQNHEISPNLKKNINFHQNGIRSSVHRCGKRINRTEDVPCFRCRLQIRSHAK